MNHGVSRRRNGEIRLRLRADEREVLRSLPGQLRELLEIAPDDPSVRRLSPPAYPNLPEHEDEYRRFMGSELEERKVAALSVMEKTADAERLSEDEAQAWLSAVNSLRLVLGTRLDVSEDMVHAEVDPADPRAAGLALYGYLSWLLDQLVDALAHGLPEVADDDDEVG